MRALPRTLRASLHVLPAALAFASACSDLSAPSSDPQVLPRPAADPPGAKRINVYTQNLYVGADVDAVIAALASGDQAAALDALSHAVATLHRTSFEARAAAIADEIARVRPDVVGFQEGSKIDVDLTPLGAPIVAHEDFLVTLRNALAARGLSGYAVADTITNIQASLLSGLVSLPDYDIMLANTARVTVGSPITKGNTCCHLSGLADSGPPAGTFDQRIDYVFARGFGVVGRDLHGQITRYGVLKPDQLTGPDGTLWPSDHAGLVATLVAPAAIGAAR